uniref:Uncharacterized protein n=1 Tax=Candidatus Methanogaster sp. ANME-2c ERB4 TaxID=2759911 RepID=A0A7G9YR08_9EURY|nr:hypothetical protein BPCBKEJI_00020 [Methanosarcinales archaeon ANME-2c ERB4]
MPDHGDAEGVMPASLLCFRGLGSRVPGGDARCDEDFGAIIWLSGILSCSEMTLN